MLVFFDPKVKYKKKLMSVILLSIEKFMMLLKIAQHYVTEKMNIIFSGSVS